MSQPVVRRLAEFAAAPLPAAMAAEITADVARRVRDLFGVALAAGATEPASVVAGVVERWGGREECGLIGRAGRYPAPAAALVNGTLGHALDFDDTHLPSVLHPSASVVPAALAAAQSSGRDGRELVRAIAIGDEICVRLGMAGYDRANRASIFFERGLHATSICGAIGSAAAAGVLLGLDADRLAHAMAIAASMGAGILEANRTGGTVKPVHCGWAAHGGVTAAELAWAGLTGPPTALEGRFGWLMAFCGERADPEAITADLGERWELLQMHFKPYPANHFTHAGIDAALELRERGLGPDDLSEVQIGVATSTLRTIAQPASEKAQPPSGYAGTLQRAVHVRGGDVRRVGTGSGARRLHRRVGPRAAATGARRPCLLCGRCRLRRVVSGSAAGGRARSDRRRRTARGAGDGQPRRPRPATHR